MFGGKTLGLGKKSLSGRYDDDHIGKRVGMMVLVGNIVNVFGNGEIVFQQLGP